MRRTLRAVGIGVLAGTIGFGTLLASAPAQAADNNTIVVWINEERAAYYKQVMPPTYKGYTVKVVYKSPSTFRDDLIKASGDSAPDVAINAHDWTGQLVANGTIVKLNVPASAIKAFDPQAINGFRYGTGIYGIPMQVENIAMITNKKLVPVAPKTFDELSKMALALKKAGKVTVPFAVQQGSGGDAYHMEPLFTGLGGYVFGQNPNGSFNPKNVGLYNPTFAKNAHMIDEWNASGLISSAVTADVAKNAFLSGKAPFWITGPWFAPDLSKVKFPYTITKVPTIVPGINPMPFGGAQGAWVTKWAQVHGVQLGANTLVTSLFASPTFQLNLYKNDGRMPANLVAQKGVTDKRLAAWAAAGRGAVPMPNIPQMDAVWGALGGAWVNSTKGKSAIPAAKAFAQAQAAVKKTIG
jgi:arabinogalactan oligomer / maltooligosaccharide transport system substrate-binding protein